MGCGTSFVRYLFFAFNFIFWVLGIVVFAMGIYSRVETDGWKALIDTSTLFVAANLLIASGVIVATLGFFGCCGAIKKWQWMLIIYSILVILIFILEIIAGGLAYQNKAKVQAALTKGLNKGIKENYGKTDSLSKGITKAIDILQRKVKCCGSNSSKDFPNGPPDSCCEIEKKDCGKIPANLWTKGCIEEGKTFVKDNLWLIGGVGVGIAIVQLLSIAFAVGLICAFKKEEKEGTTA